jgi:SAM-dependent methyltransferase
MSDVARLAESEDVLMCYRHFLRREPESEAAIESHLSGKPTLWELLPRFEDSKEHETIRIDNGCSAIWRSQDGRSVRIEASELARKAIIEHIQRVWSKYGIEDPYYSVLTNSIYRSTNITDDLSDNFFKSGSIGVADFKFAFERNGITIDPSWHILDFGCGLGRIGEHFCRDFTYYYGVDISANHLSRAKERFCAKHISNARFFLLDDALQQDICFDVFYSVIVLQHNPPPLIYYLLDQFFKKLKPGGFVFFQLPCHLYGYSFDTESYLAGDRKRDSMEMHALPQKYVFELLSKHKLQVVEVCPFSAIGRIGISYVFFAHKPSGAE